MAVWHIASYSAEKGEKTTSLVVPGLEPGQGPDTRQGRGVFWRRFCAHEASESHVHVVVWCRCTFDLFVCRKRLVLCTRSPETRWILMLAWGMLRSNTTAAVSERLVAAGMRTRLQLGNLGAVAWAASCRVATGRFGQLVAKYGVMVACSLSCGIESDKVGWIEWSL